MDQTALFRACVKAMKMRKKHLIAEPSPRPSQNVAQHRLNAREIVANITQLKRYLIATRNDYINASHVSSTVSRLGDVDRDQIDSEMEKGIKMCNAQIREMVDFAKTEICSPQLYRHRKAVIAIVEEYLKAFCKMYSEQKAVRIKKATDMKRMSRLSTLAKLVQEREQRAKMERKEASDTTTDTKEIGSNTKSSTSNERVTAEPDSVLRQRKRKPETSRKSEPKSKYSGDEKSSPVVLDEDLSPMQRTQLQKENDQIYEQMNSMVDEIQQIEGKVVEIARLQEVFTEKILEQDDQIIRINEVAIHTTENVKYGNEQIREAMKRGASMRVWILFFLLVLTFTLLFLDWYND